VDEPWKLFQKRMWHSGRPHQRRNCKIERSPSKKPAAEQPRRLIVATGNNRRDFLKSGGAALAATAFASSARSYGAIAGANDRIRVGVVGCGDRMKGGDLPAFQKSANELNFQIVAVSDIWNRLRDEGAAYIEKL